MKNSQLRLIFKQMSFTSYSYSLCHKKYEPSELNYYIFRNELTHLDINSLYSPKQMDVMYENWSLYKYKKFSTQAHVKAKCRSCWPPCPWGWLRSARKKGGPPITSICIDICWIKKGFFLSAFFIENFVSEGSRFLSPGVSFSDSCFFALKGQLDKINPILSNKQAE